jgi:hypothetical protein
MALTADVPGPAGSTDVSLPVCPTAAGPGRLPTADRGWPARLLAHPRGREALLLVPLLLIVFVRPIRVLTDPDYWWHVRTGQYILDTHHIPTVDPFSYTAAGQPWVTHEWLTEVLFYLVQHAVGYVGNVLLFGGFGVITWLAVYLATRRWGAGPLASAFLMFFSYLIGLGSFYVAPQAITAMLLAVYALVLADFKRHGGRRVWLLPPLMALWVNCHGGYVIGLGVLGLMLVGEHLAARSGQPVPPLNTLRWVTVATFAATLLSPLGLNVLTYPFTQAGPTSPAMQHVTEFQSPDFHQPAFLFFAASLLIAIALGLHRRPLGPTELLWALVLALLALQSSRHVILYGLVTTPLIGARLAAEFPDLRRSLSELRRPLILALLWPVAGYLLYTALLAPGRQPPRQVHATPTTASYPAGAVSYLQTHALPGHLFNTYEWGGYLIDQLYPQRRVFIDGRIGVYGEAFAEKYYQVVGLGPHWQQVLDDYHVQTALVPTDSPLAVVLAGDPGWHQVYHDQTAAIFTR